MCPIIKKATESRLAVFVVVWFILTFSLSGMICVTMAIVDFCRDTSLMCFSDVLMCFCLAGILAFALTAWEFFFPMDNY